MAPGGIPDSASVESDRTPETRGAPAAAVVAAAGEHALNLACRASARPVGLALCYHRIDERTGNKATELVPALATADFERQVDRLAGRYRLVRASDLLEAARSRQRFERLPVAITFDDDAPTHLRFAAPILERIGATATFFINGASLEAAHEFWFERLQRGWEVGSIDAELLAGHGVLVGARGPE